MSPFIRLDFEGQVAIITLARAEKEYGVPQDIIVGILGVETVYGRNTGRFRVLDVLTSLAPNLQVIVLTCHDDRYRGVGHAVRFEKVES